MAVHVSTQSTGDTVLPKTMSMGIIGTFIANVFANAGFVGSAQANTNGVHPGIGIFATSQTRDSVAFSAMTGQSSNSVSMANLWMELRNWAPG